ncbi:MAG: family 43 glycosylhydrolase [Nocardioides sp.]|uniref:family 43 glycosylhydrolase n=1 Tax=Nocardioides sp. TaxID=35761 RepID=UPI0039E4B5EE
MLRAGSILGLVIMLVTGLPTPSATPAAASVASAAGSGRATYTNPVTAGTVDTFPDPSMIRAYDGHWYAYGTTNPILNSAGETGEHVLPILRSDDLVHWSHVSDVFSTSGTPSWWPSSARAWAPDIRYVDGEYYLYYALSTGGVALLTSDSPTGEWTDHGLVVPASDSGCPTGNIDQAMFTDTDGTHYLYWGSYDTICVARLNATATALDGTVTQVARGRRMEGGYAVHRGRYYYLFYSDGGCCDGAFSGYTVKVGRSTSPTGPFLTPQGEDLMDLTSKGGIVLTATGNGWVGPGHNGFVTDLSGQDYLVYHAIPESDPDFGPVQGAGGGTLNLTKRPMLIDRLDWIDGWPVVNGGAGPSSTPQSAPVTTSLAGSTVSASLDAGHGADRALSARAVRGDVRVEGSLKGDRVGLVVSWQSPRNNVVATLDRERLVVKATRGGRTTTATAALPATFDHDSWHRVTAERRGRRLSVEVSADRLGDAVATADLTLPDSATGGRVGAVAWSGTGTAADVGAARLYRPHTTRVADPSVGQLLTDYSDEFDGTGAPEAVNSNWQWVRGGDTGATETDGALVWPTQSGDLTGSGNDASVLLRDAPTGDYTVETKLTFDGTRGNQQAGLVLYDTDDRYVKLAHSLLPLSNSSSYLHVTEFQKEGARPTYTPPTAVFAGPMFGAAPATTTWLRLRYHQDSAGARHVVRMASSTDGRHWTWGGVWTLPIVDSRPLRIGLVSMNTTGATARFDYLRVYRNG